LVFSHLCFFTIVFSHFPVKIPNGIDRNVKTKCYLSIYQVYIPDEQLCPELIPISLTG
jgi:hypothetical protein